MLAIVNRLVQIPCADTFRVRRFSSPNYLIVNDVHLKSETISTLGLIRFGGLRFRNDTTRVTHGNHSVPTSPENNALAIRNWLLAAGRQLTPTPPPGGAGREIVPHGGATAAWRRCRVLPADRAPGPGPPEDLGASKLPVVSRFDCVDLGRERVQEQQVCFPDSWTGGHGTDP
jgi:hypothetical protein